MKINKNGLQNKIIRQLKSTPRISKNSRTFWRIEKVSRLAAFLMRETNRTRSLVIQLLLEKLLRKYSAPKEKVGKAIKKSWAANFFSKWLWNLPPTHFYKTILPFGFLETNFKQFHSHDSTTHKCIIYILPKKMLYARKRGGGAEKCVIQIEFYFVYSNDCWNKGKKLKVTVVMVAFRPIIMKIFM